MSEKDGGDIKFQINEEVDADGQEMLLETPLDTAAGPAADDGQTVALDATEIQEVQLEGVDGAPPQADAATETLFEEPLGGELDELVTGEPFNLDEHSAVGDAIAVEAPILEEEVVFEATQEGATKVLKMPSLLP